MPNNGFPDNSSILFGRHAELAYLIERSQRPGITAILGQPQMGKSWLLLEAARRLSTVGWPAPAFGTSASVPLVGRVESEGEAADMLPRAVQDLYTRWLSDATYREQARVVFAQQRQDFIGRIGEAVGSLVETVVKSHGPVGAAGGNAVKQTFEGLASANRDLKSGGITLPTLQTEDSRELLAIVYRITGRAAVLIFDQWEKSPNLKKEASILDSLLRQLASWPPMHIILGSRADKESRSEIADLEQSYPELVASRSLGPMNLEDQQVSDEMLAWLRQQVPATRTLSDSDLLERIAGYPRVLARWAHPDNARTMRTQADLAAIADDANRYRYREFEKLLPSLSAEEQGIAARLLLLPAIKDADTWRALRPIVLNGSSGALLDELSEKGWLDASSPPTHGHTKRAEAAYVCFGKKRREGMRETAESLIRALAGEVHDLTPRTLPYTVCLLTARHIASELDLSPLAQALCEAAFTLYEEPGVESGKFMGITAASAAPGSPLLAMGLFNALVYAKQENDLDRRDGLLLELRALAAAYPADAAVRERLANGLFNTLIGAKQENDLARRDGLLQELRTLAEAYPGDAAVRERLAMGLFNALVYAKQENDLDRRDGLLLELRALAAAYPADAAVREQLAKGLFNTLIGAKQENDLARRDGLLQELRTLAEAYPGDAAVRERLAKGLFSTLIDAKEENDLARRDGLLEELRALAAAYPADAAVRENLAMGLFNTLNDAKQENDLARRDGLLQELRTLAEAYPADAAVREWLAKGLNNTLVDAKQENDLARRDGLLQELRALAEAYPADAAVRERLANGLFNTLNDAKQENDLDRRDGLLLELQTLAAAYPADAAVRETWPWACSTR